MLVMSGQAPTYILHYAVEPTATSRARLVEACRFEMNHDLLHDLSGQARTYSYTSCFVPVWGAFFTPLSGGGGLAYDDVSCGALLKGGHG